MAGPPHYQEIYTLKYQLCLTNNVELESTSAAKYIGVTIADDLSWSSHIDNTATKANQTLGFLKRNIRVHNNNLLLIKHLSGNTWIMLLTVWYPTTTKI